MLDTIYGELEKACHKRNWSLGVLDFLIICGDFQAVRNERDLNCMSCPRRFRALGDFHKYYSGMKKAPVLTIVIGGNHEASNYFAELSLGGWLAPNIYYLGNVGIIRYGPYRIAGLSGIYKSGTYQKPHSATLSYDRNEIKNVYHVRECDVSKLLQVKNPVDICLSHDWPRRIEWHGNYQQLFTEKPHFFESAKIDSLGSAPAEQVMSYLRPSYWFSGHMHVRYEAIVHHNEDADIFKQLNVHENFREQLPRTMSRYANLVKKTAPKSVPAAITNTVTRFLALDKPGTNHNFLETLEIDISPDQVAGMNERYMQKTSEGKFYLRYDEEWLAVLRSSSKHKVDDSDLGTISTSLDAGAPLNGGSELHWVRENITAKGLLKIPENFKMHAPVQNATDQGNIDEQPPEYSNSQTKEFCRLLGIRNRFSIGLDDDEEDS